MHDHVTSIGETRRRFEAAAMLLSSDLLFTELVAWKQVQDRYERTQYYHDGNDNQNQGLSGVADGETGVLADLLTMMREARDDMVVK